MTEREQLMYQVLGKISEADAPLVFKGALITKLILSEHGYSDLERQTRDIDANWIGSPPSMSELENTINRSLSSLEGQFRAEAYREYGEKMSAGIYLVNSATGEKMMTMDIDIRPICGSRTYHYGEMSIRGVLADEILADKITGLSGMKVFRRAKDLIDIYALTHCINVATAEIYEVIARKRLALGNFAELLIRRADAEHAYGKLQGVEGKPAFGTVYPYLTAFVQPFARKDETPRLWNSNKLIWEDGSHTSEKPSLLDNLHAAEQKVREQEVSLNKNQHKPEHDL